MRTDPTYWFDAGKTDRDIGNNYPALTLEDFYRDIEDEGLAEQCSNAYTNGFNSPVTDEDLERIGYSDGFNDSLPNPKYENNEIYMEAWAEGCWES